MSDNQLWAKDIRNGHYSVVFRNKYALTKTELIKIFSQFGKITRILARGDDTGFHFINYETFEEVQRAIHGLQNNNNIKLVPHRPKRKELSNQVNHYNDQNKNTNYSVSTTQFMKPKKKEVDLFKYGNTTSKTSQQITTFNSNNIKDLLQNKSIICNHQINATNKSQKHSTIQSISTQDLFCSKINNAYSLTNSLNFKENDQIPKLITEANCKTIEKSKNILIAEEIIVANIHQSYGSAYFLHLFQNFDPLAVSYIEIHNHIRYCYIYFKTEQHAIQVENQFDNYNLSGKKLIILRSCTLIKEALST
jgi:hypothetical protein